MVVEWLAFILSIVITYFILKVINRNTIGTTGAYVKRALIVWFVVFLILAAIFGLV